MGRIAGKKEILVGHHYRKEWAEKLWPLFKSRGLKEFNMDSVALEIGKSKATVYKYFKNREDILTLILSDLLTNLSVFKSILKDESLDYISRYKNSVELISIELTGISGKFLFDLKKFHPELWKMIEDFKKLVILELEKFYKLGVKRNLLGDTSVELLKVGDEIFLNALLDPSFLLKNKLKLEESLRAYFENKMFGMLKR